VPLNIGNAEATSGMAQNIYRAIDEVLRPPMEEGDVPADAIQQSQEAWKKLGYAIAAGVISHLQRDPPTKTEYAEVFSSSAQDAEFWDWLGDFVEVFETWASSPTSGVSTLKASLNGFLSANPSPEELKGVIR
jgi:hypothetical protein